MDGLMTSGGIWGDVSSLRGVHSEGESSEVASRTRTRGTTMNKTLGGSRQGPSVRMPVGANAWPTETH